MAADANDAVSGYISEMQAEGLAGPKTARIVILVSSADALKKLLTSWPTPDFSNLCGVDFLMLAMAYLLLGGNDAKNDGGGGTK